MNKVESFGIIPLTHENGEWKVCLVLNKSGNHWGFPKGRKQNNDEQPLEAAKRELAEETGLKVVRCLQDFPLIEHYQFLSHGETMVKTVAYFPALVSGELKLQEEEIREGRWVSFEEALQLLTFKEGRSIMEQTLKIVR